MRYLGPMLKPTSTHWGNYRVEAENGRILAVHGYPEDLDPTPLAQNLLAALDPQARVAQPAVRAGYLKNPEGRTGEGRGQEEMVPVSWDEALKLAAAALERTRQRHGNPAIYGGSYGWASAGRFHHAQSQIHRFLNCIGGCTRSVHSYSAGAAEVIVPRVLGMDFFQAMFQAPTLEDIAEQARLVVCFGGLALKNTQVMSGGLGGHDARTQLRALASRGIRFVNVSPIREDLPEFLAGEWWPIRPCSDAALMLALAHVLVTEELCDRDFLARCTVGLEQFLPYLLGETDGQPKDCRWAAALTELDAERIRALARSMARQRTLIGISWSLQRSEHGEQTYWLATVLGALLGSHGLPGAGVAYGYGSMHNIGFSGRRLPNFAVPALPQGVNPVKQRIPVARIADILLRPGQPFDFNGRRVQPPEIELVYWAGGNPFHHHQDLNRLCRAWAKPQTIIINEPFWTATAQRADILLPATTPLERDDLGITSYDCRFTPMRQAVPPFQEAWDDHAIFAALAERLGVGAAFAEGRSAMQWLRHLYAELRGNASAAGVRLPPFAQFWAGEQISLRDQLPDRAFRLEEFRRDPEGAPLDTPSGKIEIHSQAIAGFGCDDCLGHPAWFPKQEFLGSPRSRRFPLHLVSNQPKGRLHSQYDHGPASQAHKRAGREVLRMNPEDAASRGIRKGDLVRVFNDRGECLAAAEPSDDLRPSVAELPTGAWYAPVQPGGLDSSGNPNVLTRDAGTSKLAQGSTAHSCLVQVERWSGGGVQPTPRAASRSRNAVGEQPVQR